MKKSLCLLFLFCLSCAVLNAQTKRALVIAVGNYPNPRVNGWPEISSTNDVPLIKAALAKQDFKNIWTLIDAQATRVGIEKALDKLIDSSRSGDIVVIHISSHGQQIEDDNDGEEADGLDESIVPYGAVYSSDLNAFSRYSEGYLRDDVFGEKITRLRNKLGSKGDILVTIDACHSGTGSRGPATVKSRGGNAPMVSTNFAKKTQAGKKDVKGVFKESTATALNKDAATYVVISGAQAQEKNYECLDDEGNTTGSLSYALGKALSTISGKLTYRGLFAQIEDVMREKAPQQKPVLEGDGIDRQLFGGKVEIQKPYLQVDLSLSNSDTIYVNSGSVAGVTPGSLVGFFPSGTSKPDMQDTLAAGIVVSATNFTAVIKLNQSRADFAQKAPWPFVLEMSYGSAPVNLILDSLDAGNAKKVKDALKELTNMNFGNNGELYLVPSDSRNGYSLRFANSGVIFDDNIDLNNAPAVKNLMKRYARYRYLRDLRVSEDELSVDIRLVFLDAKKNIDEKRTAERTKFGVLELQEGDTVYLKIKNMGRKRAYINVVDIQPDGYINPIMPNRKLKDMKGLPRPLTPDQCVVNAGDSVLNRDMMITIAPPYGEEIFKVFLSTAQLDLEELLAGNSDENSKSRGILNNLAKTFKNSNNITTRGAGTASVGGNDGTIFGLNFTIKRKE